MMQDIFNVAYGICQQYVNIILAAVATYAFSTYRSLIDEPERLVEQMNITLRGSLLAIVPALVGVMVFRDIFLVLMYSESFLSAADMLQLQLIGDLFKVFGWCIGMTILASGRVYLHVFNDVLYWLIAWIVLNFGLASIGPVAASAGMTSGHMVLSAVVYVIARKQLNFRLTSANQRLWIGSLVLVGWTYFIAGQDRWIGGGATLAGLLVWGGMCVQSDERQQLSRWVHDRIAKFVRKEPPSALPEAESVRKEGLEKDE